MYNNLLLSKNILCMKCHYHLKHHHYISVSSSLERSGSSTESITSSGLPTTSSGDAAILSSGICCCLIDNRYTNCTSVHNYLTIKVGSQYGELYTSIFTSVLNVTIFVFFLFACLSNMSFKYSSSSLKYCREEIKCKTSYSMLSMILTISITSSQQETYCTISSCSSSISGLIHLAILLSWSQQMKITTLRHYWTIWLNLAKKSLRKSLKVTS